MIVILAKDSLRDVINNIVKNEDDIILKKYGNIEKHETISIINRMYFSTLIIQRGIISDNDMFDLLVNIRILKPKVRVIFITIKSKAGDQLLAKLVSKGIYDIYNCDSNDIDKITNDLISLLYEQPLSYADAAKWDKDTRVLSKDTKSYVTKKIAITNLSSSAGSTFIATTLAQVLADNGYSTSFVELPVKSEIFNIMGLSLYENERKKFYSYPHAIANCQTHSIKQDYIFSNINWIVSDTRLPKIDNWGFEETLRLIFSSNNSQYTIIDLGSCLQANDLSKLSTIINTFVVVIDPLPIKILNSQQDLDYYIDLKKNGTNIVFLVNKWSNGLKKNSIVRLLNLEPDVYWPSIDLYQIYKSAYACMVPYSNRKIKHDMDKHILTNIKKILPNFTEKKKSIFGKR